VVRVIGRDDHRSTDGLIPVKVDLNALLHSRLDAWESLPDRRINATVHDPVAVGCGDHAVVFGKLLKAPMHNGDLRVCRERLPPG